MTSALEKDETKTSSCIPEWSPEHSLTYSKTTTETKSLSTVEQHEGEVVVNVFGPCRLARGTSIEKNYNTI